jgi:hypothetical protein
MFLFTPTIELMKLSGKSWQVVAISHKEGDGQIFVSSIHKFMTTLVIVMFGLIWPKLTL